MKENEKILILDFHGEYNQLIARRVRECDVYSEIVPFDTSLDKIKEIAPKGIIFTGSPFSVYNENAPMIDKEILNLGIPILGICYGMQLITYLLGGNVEKANKREYATTAVKLESTSPLFAGFENENNCLMTHSDFVSKLPDGFVNIASTASCPNAGMSDEKKKIYGIQFHPEVNHTVNGIKILHNFVYKICGCSRRMENVFFCRRICKSFKGKNWRQKSIMCLIWWC